MKVDLQKYIAVMSKSITSILHNKVIAMYIYGSVALNDYKYGWSDIDILCLTDDNLTEMEKERCLTLRQTLMNTEHNNIYRTFEGAILPLSDFLSGEYSEIVYWGTSGQRITDEYCFDVFSQYELYNHAQLVYGTDICDKMERPTYNQLRKGVIDHYQTIRKYAVKTNESLYACGWLLDISRCIYTLRTGQVIAKTRAGEWALEQNLCPVCDSLLKTLLVRNNPTIYKNDTEIKSWLCTLGSKIQEYANVLENEIEMTKSQPHSH